MQFTEEIRLGEVARLRGNTEDARTHFQNAINLDPNRSAGYLGLAKMAKSSGSYAQAVEFAKQATDRGPGNSEAWLIMGDSALYLGNRPQARTAYEKYLDLVPGGPDSNRIRDQVLPTLTGQ